MRSEWPCESVLPIQEWFVIVAFRKRCSYCRATLNPGALELLPKVVGLPQVRCKRCSRFTKLSLVVTIASSVAGVLAAALVLACYGAVAGSLFGTPIADGTILLMLPIGCAAWMLGYIAFATCCYGIQGN
jgi:hypothetical protein